MTDFIEIEDLLVRTIIGVNPEERENRQDVVISLRLDTDLRPAARTDSIDDAVNYRTITKSVIAFVEQSSFHLVEKLAEEIARLCLREPRVERVRVHLRKPGALRFSRTVGVCIERNRNDFQPRS
ncbi:Dihydroneopterin aldolase [Caulifigura coniformis]|uniref:7,8-dihydroneopterin aldolase n=1 Tax=Caulifigura coniformis TaxID=2527983 RepID=A0A517SAC8_9PLAN|nr:dihydroneopterin aldolase [Caulifigura coniformis]QDT53091.1 Dihydroneopterin aldolase [Caulifigura coniformis]